MLDRFVRNIVEKEGRKTVVEIPVEDISVNPYQPRRNFDEGKLQGLAQSIKELGVIQPIIVRRLGAGYELVTGERRLRASKIAGMRTIPAIVRVINDQDMIEITFIENLQREQLDEIEKAEAYGQLVREKSASIEHIAERVGKDVDTIKTKLWMLQLPHVVRKALSLKLISTEHARLISKIPAQKRQISMLERICREKIDPRRLEEILTSEGIDLSGEIRSADQTIKSLHMKGSYPEGSLELLEMCMELMRDFVTAMRATGVNVKIKEEFSKTGMELNLSFPFESESNPEAEK